MRYEDQTRLAHGRRPDALRSFPVPPPLGLGSPASGPPPPAVDVFSVSSRLSRRA